MLIWSLLTLVHLVAASSLFRIARPIKTLSTRNLVVARQSSTSTNTTVPTECKSDCDPIDAVLAQTQDECPPEDCCQSDFIIGYANCLECLGIALGATNFTTAQQALNNLTMQCDDTEHNVPSLTLPGPVASGALSSAFATNTPSTNVPANASPANASPTLFTIVPALSSSTPTQSTTDSSPSQSTNTTTSSAKQSCLIPHLLHVQVSVVLLGGLVHLAL